MSDRPRRAALHQRSDSETNTLRTIQSSKSNNSSVSQKGNDVSTWQPPTGATVSRDSTRSSSRTNSTNRSGRLRPSASLDSLPPIAPLKIHKRLSSSISVARDPPTTSTTTKGKEVASSKPVATGRTRSLSTTAAGTQSYPKSILKKPSKPALPPFTSEEYNRKSSTWVGSNSNDPVLLRSRMNARTLRIVRNSSDDGVSSDDGQYDIVGRRRSTSVTISSRSAQLGSESESGSYVESVGRAISGRSASGRAVSSPLYGRAHSPQESQPSASAKQFPAWARYFYGKKGGRGSVIVPERSGSAHGNEGVGIAIFDPTAHRGPRRMASSHSIPGIDWVGTRTRDPEVATMWSLPHLDQAPLTGFESINRQLVLFCLGFILPLCWIIAAVLPLPPHAEITKEPKSNQQQLEYTADIEGARVFTTEEVEIYQNARWWRRVNRMLAPIGLVVIGAIIALAVVAATRGA
ncbi:hypothetical protein L873DRAFT_1662333 [Choiromyces venosus 120613-1]|uniref:Serine-rich protein n=1 Tax=Choiromyces venosus 120613-1 TaxID=1336337 RepID=A0A3N4K5G8_9PEZI|nr:hypothetical protein L873DRAFT_1662333 [Choiromyces venosus 120613-1]